jgi:hypothetical protein
VRTNQEIFDKIYKRHRWIWGSGTGSIPFLNKPFIDFVNNFLEIHPEIKVVIDIGCGDHQIGKCLKLEHKKYIGCDVAGVVLEKTRKKFSSTNKEFFRLDAVAEKLPPGDLIIVKDVLQHLQNQDVSCILSKLSHYHFVIVQNDMYSKNSFLRKRRENKDIRSGKVRPLDITKEPFKADYSLVLKYTEGMRYFLNIFRRLLLLAPIKKGIYVKYLSATK